MVIALWRHDGGTLHNVLFLTTASNVNSWADVAQEFRLNEARLWQACDTK